MGKLPSDAACSKMIGFLLYWHAKQRGWELTGARGVPKVDYGLAEGEEDCIRILAIQGWGDGSGWRLGVRLSDGTQTTVSSSEGFQAAMAKARRMDREHSARAEKLRAEAHQEGALYETRYAT